MNILVGVTGSVATIKLTELLEELQAKIPGVSIRVVATKQARIFLKDQTIAAIYGDEDEWTTWNRKGDPVLHIELRKWADMFLIAPISANSLAKIANGLCDNLLTSIVRAWDRGKRIILAPAMNTYMWENPLTEKHLQSVQQTYNAEVVPPKADYLLACGDRGSGAMAGIESIVDVVLSNSRN